MAAFTPYTFAAGEPLTVSLFNDHISGPLNILGPGDGTAQTVGAVNGIPVEVLIGTSSALMITGHILGVRSDFGAGLLARFGATFRRAGGNVVLAGSYCDVYEDSAGAPTAFVTAAAPNFCRVAVTGVAAETWNWKAVYLVSEL